MTRIRKRTIGLFTGTLAIITAMIATSVIRTDSYNRKIHHSTFEGSELFSEEAPKTKPVSVNAIARSSTWMKAFDLNNEGITEHNYQAYTYDFIVSNNTGDEVSDYSFKVTFDKEVFLMSAWNGSLEIHQNNGSGETVSTIPDLREFNADEYDIETVTFYGEVLVRMRPGDFLIYIPSSSENAMEVPIEPYEATAPGIIFIGEDINETRLEIDYRFHRLITSVPLFWVSVAELGIWFIVLIIYAITSAQIKKYNERHERDNEIIRESIETFTGFIDAKDPYTNGHSRRVADYTRMIAEKMGYEGEELDRVYYVALLHDCGKIGVPDNILRKPGRLTDEEFEIIKSHTVRGGEILSSFKSLKNVNEGALYHHERYDGMGYPEKRAGEGIPLIARMICVADAFDAMNSNRVYRNKLTKEDIINEIEKNKGKQFDPNIADTFLRILRDRSFDF